MPRKYPMTSVARRRYVGLAAAARTLGASCELTFLSLVAMGIAPRDYDPIRRPQANAERVRRIEAMLAGRCAPQGLRDVTLEACAGP